MLKSILGVVAGLVVAFAAVMAGEFLVHMLTGGPTVDMTDRAAVEAMMAATPIGSRLGVVLTYFVAVLLGGLTAARVTGGRWAAWVVAGVLLAATIANFVMLPHPVWMVAASVVLIGVAGGLGGKLGARA